MSFSVRKRRVEIVVPQATPLDRVRSQAAWAMDRVGPAAVTARDVAAHTIEDARVWAAPRLERAAHAVEERIAPRVSAMLSDAARLVDPGGPVKAKRRWPVLTLLAGVALGVAGYLMYRNNQRWVEAMAGDGLAEADERLGDPERGTAERP